MRLRLAAVAVGAGALVLLGACGGEKSGSQNPPAGGEPTLTIVPPSEPSEPSEGPGVPPADAVAVPGDQLDFAALPEGYPKQVWTVGDGRILVAKAQEGGCNRASAEVTEQTDARVVLTLVETQPAQPGMCTMDIRYPVVSVTLDEPLGDRTVTLRAERRQA
jgi:hypothetical protein